MKRLLIALTLGTALLFTATPAKADFDWDYPDGTLALIWAEPGGHAAIFVDIPGDRDIFTIHTTHSSTPNFFSLGYGGAYAYWLNYLYTDTFGDWVYEVYIDQGGGFFLVGFYFL